MFTATRFAPALRASARAFSTSRASLDVSRLTLVGRLGADPVLRETSAGKPYVTYTVATQNGIAVRKEDGTYTTPTTSWHTVFVFNERALDSVQKVGKGSTVYVEADLEMRPSEPINGQSVSDRVILKQNTMRVINRVKSETAEAEPTE